MQALPQTTMLNNITQPFFSLDRKWILGTKNRFIIIFKEAVYLVKKTLKDSERLIREPFLSREIM